MQNYKVTIEETVAMDVDVNADNEDEAIRIVSDLYHDGHIVLEPGNLIDVKFDISENTRKKQILLTGTAIIENGNIKLDNDTFVKNLMLIDSTMPQIFEYLLKKHLQVKHLPIKGLTKKCAEDNICKIQMKDVICYYRKKVTDMLYAVLHGMNCDEAWNGQSNSRAIYIFNSGVTFSLYDRVSLIEHLWENAYIEIKGKINTEIKREMEWTICI